MYQQILILYLFDSALDSKVVSWAFYDGTGKETTWPGYSDEPPYETGLDALKDKWHLLHISPVPSRNPGQETRLNSFRHEFVFEKKTNKK